MTEQFMTANELKHLIDSLAQDIAFRYKGIEGSICPFSRSDISITYGDTEMTVDSVDAVMSCGLLGAPLKDICDVVEFE